MRLYQSQKQDSPCGNTHKRESAMPETQLLQIRTPPIMSNLKFRMPALRRRARRCHKSTKHPRLTRMIWSRLSTLKRRVTVSRDAPMIWAISSCVNATPHPHSIAGALAKIPAPSKDQPGQFFQSCFRQGQHPRVIDKVAELRLNISPNPGRMSAGFPAGSADPAGK